MKKNLTLILVASTSFLAGCCTAPHVTKWEYKQTPTQLTDQSLNKMADEGWSVVCIGTDSNNGHFYVLKRPKK